MPKKHLTTVLTNTPLTKTVFEMKLNAEELARQAVPGQFVHIRCGDGNLLRRPISIADVGNGVVTVVVEVRGEGTKWLFERRTGDQIDLLGPLGNGFEVTGKNIILVGGGIGVPPMLYTARKADGKATAVLGFRNSSCIIMTEQFEEVCKSVHVTTDDGSAGERGSVALPLGRLLAEGGYDAVLACGPRAMLKAVADLSSKNHVPCLVSLEERMGCGIGACLVCACKTKKDGHEHMSHVCKDGPVFKAEEVIW